MKQAKILLLDFNPADGLSCTLRGILESSNPGIQLQQESIGAYGPAFCNSYLSRITSRFNPDVIFLVLCSNPLMQANTLFQSMKRELLQRLILVLMEAGKSDEIFALLKLGVADFITPPLKAIDILPRIWRLQEQTRREETLIPRLKEKLGLKQLVGESPVFLAEIKKIPLVAQCDAGILISGETGTGKEVYARAIHYLSLRRSKPFLPVNCGAIPVELVENELFGHERGAFTGASTSQPGLIQEADGGTLFLDEIDCLPPLAQTKLLRFLQEKEYRSVGSAKMCQADVRIIAATNVNLEVALREGTLRRDLYYRLNIIPIRLPPLRERREDIPLLARHFLTKYAAEFNKPVTDFSLDALHLLTLYEWPGNVRELEHVVQRSIVLSERAILRKDDVALPCLEATSYQGSFQEAKAKVVAQFEKSYIQGLLLSHRGNITKAAQAAQKNRRAFWQLMRKHRIDPQNLRSGIL